MATQPINPIQAQAMLAYFQNPQGFLQNAYNNATLQGGWASAPQAMYPTTNQQIPYTQPIAQTQREEIPPWVQETLRPTSNPAEDPFVTNPELYGALNQDLENRTPAYEPTWNKEENARNMRPTGIETFNTENTLDLTEPTRERQPFDWNNPYMSMFHPYSTNLQTDFYNLGRFIGMEQGSPGRGLGIASSGVAAGLGSARTLMSGLATQKATNRTLDTARTNMQQQLYTPNLGYRNTNYLGGLGG